ncbi:MAG: DUF3365 domain-containing protein [Hyphomicrobiaceae bacterium]|nr:DUF3365 domain-containing protein [Hyphomicrobiaceae bacterium]
MVHTLVFRCALCVFVLAAGPASAADPALEERVKAARAAVQQLAGQLKGELVGALESGGPVKAMEVCSVVAPQLAASVADSARLSIGRTALKVRNPGNRPDAFETQHLAAFAARLAAGEDVAKIDHAEIVTDAAGTRVFRYMKAIPMAEKPCAACHGSVIQPDVKAQIDTLYPEDRAVGFAAGELRGAFTVSQKME